MLESGELKKTATEIKKVQFNGYSIPLYIDLLVELFNMCSKTIALINNIISAQHHLEQYQIRCQDRTDKADVI